MIGHFAHFAIANDVDAKIYLACDGCGDCFRDTRLQFILVNGYSLILKH